MSLKSLFGTISRDLFWGWFLSKKKDNDTRNLIKEKIFFQNSIIICWKIYFAIIDQFPFNLFFEKFLKKSRKAFSDLFRFLYLFNLRKYT